MYLLLFFVKMCDLYDKFSQKIHVSILFILKNYNIVFVRNNLLEDTECSHVTN